MRTRACGHMHARMDTRMCEQRAAYLDKGSWDKLSSCTKPDASRHQNMRHAKGWSLVAARSSNASKPPHRAEALESSMSSCRHATVHTSLSTQAGTNAVCTHKHTTRDHGVVALSCTGHTATQVQAVGTTAVPAPASPLLRIHKARC